MFWNNIPISKEVRYYINLIYYEEYTFFNYNI